MNQKNLEILLNFLIEDEKKEEKLLKLIKILQIKTFSILPHIMSIRFTDRKCCIYNQNEFGVFEKNESIKKSELLELKRQIINPIIRDSGKEYYVNFNNKSSFIMRLTRKRNAKLVFLVPELVSLISIDKGYFFIQYSLRKPLYFEVGTQKRKFVESIIPHLAVCLV